MSEFEILTIQQANKDFILSVIVAIVSFVSVLLIYLDYRNRKSKERAEKSIEIAKEFAKSIVPKVSFLYNSFESINLDKIVNNVKFINFTDFDYGELHELYSKDDIDKYQQILNSNKGILFNDKNIDLEGFIVLLLNELEHMSMYISTKVADEKYIYNSLHQQFLKTISLLYISISLINLDNKDKYYTNIIEVFNLWKDKYIKFEKKEKKLKKKMKPQIHKIN